MPKKTSKKQQLQENLNKRTKALTADRDKLERQEVTAKLEKYKQLGLDLEWDDETPIQELKYMLEQAEASMNTEPADNNNEEIAAALGLETGEKKVPDEKNPDISDTEYIHEQDEKREANPDEGLAAHALTVKNGTPQQMYKNISANIEQWMAFLLNIEQETYHEYKGIHRKCRNLRGMLMIQKKFFKTH